MFRRDLETCLKSAFTVFGTGVLMLSMNPGLLERASLSLPAILGQFTVIFAFMTFFLSVERLFSSDWRYQLLPQTQLALWLLGVGGVIVATEGWRRLDPTPTYWIFPVGMLTWLSRGGWRWLIRSGQEMSS